MARWHRVHIRTNGYYWRPHGRGYTAHTGDAGVWTIGEAQRQTKGLGPEKHVQFVDAAAGRRVTQ